MSSEEQRPPKIHGALGESDLSSEEFRTLQPGVLLGHYRLIEEAGRGGMGVVWRARDEVLDEDVALKFLPEILASDATAMRHLREEASVLLTLTHLNIVRVRTLEAEGPLAYLVMEYLAGSTMEEVIDARLAAGRSGLTPQEALWVLDQIAPALEYAHGEGVTHRDIKPANMMLERPVRGRLNRGHARLKLTDFGLAFVATSTVTQKTGYRPSGTLPYMAPEVLMGAKPTPAADVYSVGVSLYALVSGACPFTHGDIVTQILHKDPDPLDSGDEPLDRAVEAAMDKDPARRPADVGRLRALARGEITLEQALGAEAEERADVDAPARRGPRRAAAAVALGVIGLGIAFATGALRWSTVEGIEPAGPPPVHAPAAPSPVVHLESPVPDSEGRVHTKERVITLAGRVEHGRQDRVQVRVDQELRTFLVEDERFRGTLELLPGRSVRVEVLEPAVDPPIAFEVAHDASAPRITVVSPAERARLAASSVALTLRVEDERLERVHLGDIEGTPGPNDTWQLAEVQLEREGENELLIEAHDRAGNHARRELVLVRDSQGPRLLESSPVSDDEAVKLDANLPFALTLEFDEAPRSVSFDDESALELDGFTARAELRAPESEGEWAPRWTAVDALGNERNGALRYLVQAPCRIPDGFELVDRRPGWGGFARAVRDPRTGQTFVLVDPGSFLMGSSVRGLPADESPRHLARVERGFYLAATEVTVAQWRAFVDASQQRTSAEALGWAISRDARGAGVRTQGASWRDPIPAFAAQHDVGGEHPVTQVSWTDAQAFCAHYGYRLPTEVEWECAARAGRAGLYTWGDVPAWSAGRGNFSDPWLARVVSPEGAFEAEDGFPFTAPVGTYEANPWGFFDLLGNVWEWCADSYDPSAYDPETAAALPAADEPAYVIRGGSWRSGPDDARCARRAFEAPAGRLDVLGFRVAFDPEG